MILLRTGSVGEGKSATTIGEALEHLRSGGVVASNFDLSPGWPIHATRWMVRDLWDPEARLTRAHDCWKRWFRIGSVDSINQVTQQLPDLVSGHQLKRLKKHQKKRPGIPERLGLLILDEGHIYFNSRDWRDNMPMIHFLSQSRKKGWDVVIIAHDADMIDSQIRGGLINQTEAMRNLGEMQPIPLVPLKIKHLCNGKPSFLGIRKYSGKGGGHGVVCKRKITLLTPDIGNVYETMIEFDFTDIPEEATRIGPRPALPAVGRHPRVSVPAIREALQEIHEQFQPPITPDKQTVRVEASPASTLF